MAKNTFFIRLIFIACFFACCSFVHSALIDDVVSVYSSQIGIREKSGKNDGEMVEKYLKSVGLPAGNPWCAAFVYWTFQTAGVKGMPRSGYSPVWFQKKVIYQRNGLRNKPPDRGDVFGIWFASKNRIAHVGFIDAWDDGTAYVVTVEGNTNEAGSREGDGVYRKRRLKNQIYKVSRWL